MLLHPSDADPAGTIQWLKARPHLARHHHVRLSHSKVRLDCVYQLSLCKCATGYTQLCTLSPSIICKNCRNT